MDVAKEMLDYRARNNLSQNKLAELMGVSPGAIYLIEKRKRKPRATTISKLEQLMEKE